MTDTDALLGFYRDLISPLVQRVRDLEDEAEQLRECREKLETHELVQFAQLHNLYATPGTASGEVLHDQSH